MFKRIKVENKMSPHPMTIVENVLDKITYKEGWGFKSRLSPYSNDIEIRISFLAKDSTGKRFEDGPIILTFMISFTEIMHMKDAEDFVKHKTFEAINKMEMHEIDEWLKYDGKNVRDPHPERKEK